MQRYAATGVLVDPLTQSSRQPSFGDFSGDFDYQKSQNAIISAQNAFDALPAALRKRFDNNPAELLAFIADEKNKDEAIKLGLIPKDEPIPVPEPVKVQIINDGGSPKPTE
jgi:phage internal scaffolding protein